MIFVYVTPADVVERVKAFEPTEDDLKCIALRAFGATRVGAMDTSQPTTYLAAAVMEVLKRMGEGR